MMIRSHINMTLPSVMSRYLLITAAMMSVPPVLPLLEKGDADAATAEGGTDDTSHERLVVQEDNTLGQFLDNGKEKGQGEYGKDCLYAELPSQHT